jgi:hypothetical protein
LDLQLVARLQAKAHPIGDLARNPPFLGNASNGDEAHVSNPRYLSQNCSNPVVVTLRGNLFS